MASKRPFSGTPEEKAEIRNLFKVLSVGGDPNVYPELKDIYRKYKIIFDVFGVCVDVRYGNFLHLPFSGAVMDQGSKTMDLLKCLQHLLRKKIADDNKGRYGQNMS